MEHELIPKVGMRSTPSTREGDNERHTVSSVSRSILTPVCCLHVCAVVLFKDGRRQREDGGDTPVEGRWLVDYIELLIDTLDFGLACIVNQLVQPLFQNATSAGSGCLWIVLTIHRENAA
jgi:hypothetical protein